MSLCCQDESPLERSLRVQEDFEAALESHRSLWLAEFERQKQQFEREFAQKKAALTSELEVKLGQRRAAKNMIVTLVFILRLLA